MKFAFIAGIVTRMTKAIYVKNLQKSFGKTKVLKNVSFEVEEGSILAVLGPNGAGKTTTVNILSTLLKADSGKALVAGFDVVSSDDKVRASIGLTGQFAAVDEYLTGRENIKLIGQLYHLPSKGLDDKVSGLLEQFDLVEAADRPARTYSGGMKRRLDLAMSLVASPPIIFLDEPTTGLDPRSRLTLWQMIKELAKNGKTILLTTQYMEEAEYLADNVIVIDHGKVIAEGTTKQLKSLVGAEQVEIFFTNKAMRSKAEKVLKGSVPQEGNDEGLNMPAPRGSKTLQEALEILEKNRIKVDTASLRRPTLDDVFLALTGHDTSEKESK